MAACWCRSEAVRDGLCDRHHYAERVAFREARYYWMHELGEWVVFDRRERKRVAVCAGQAEAEDLAYRLNGDTPRGRAAMEAHKAGERVGA